MDAKKESDVTSTKGRTQVERKFERELVVSRTFDAPARIVFEAWTTPELFRRWWVPKSVGMELLSCDQDVRVGGTYRLVFRHGESGSMAFHGKYLEVVPPLRLVWTNEESPDGSVTTLTGGKRRQDAARHARTLSVEGSIRGERWRRGWLVRVVRSAGRTSRHAGSVASISSILQTSGSPKSR